ncbi:hypothetical protein ACE6H2_011574 [Prunus campanulata]
MVTLTKQRSRRGKQNGNCGVQINVMEETDIRSVLMIWVLGGDIIRLFRYHL